ncbi:MAG: efflux RND transporter permease subunit [Kofleriaceae bacterium]|nr:efflux RND transporter permease subunit [Kofleriaceae bacterium]MBP6836037.1 efflux RND transporter permease subunit [Kofleriaceae bacterium]MBP9208347.1 efflux RND transporter permease subunit [Kofleriaceae bacterium]
MIAELAAASVRHRRVVILAWVAVVLVAAVGAFGLRLDALPDVTGNQVQVLTRAPGLTPEEVELRVTRPIEAALGGMPGLHLTRSTSRYGLSAVTALFDDELDPFRARQLVSEKVAGVTAALPPGVEAPELGPLTGGLGEVFHLLLRAPGRSPAELLELATLEVAPLLRAVPGVVEVNTWGGVRRRFEIRADPVRMARHGLGLEDLRAAVARSVGVVPGDAVPGERGQVLLRGDAGLGSAPALADLTIAQRGAVTVRVRDVADVDEGARPRIGAATADGRGEVVYVMAQMLRGANARDVARALRAQLPAVADVLPDDVELEVVYDRADLVDATLRTLGKNLLEGGALVIAVLLLSLGSLRAGVIVALAIPVSMLGAAAVMRQLGVGGNLMSLGAIDFGLLVDGAIVMVEHSFHRRGPDGQPLAASVEASARAVARPVFAGVLVIVLVYVPVLALHGVEGKLYRPMAITVVLALVTALALSLTLVPALLASGGAARPPARPPRLTRAIDALYGWLLPRLLRRRALVAGAAAAALIGAAVLFARAGAELTPQLDEGDLVIQTTRAPDTRVEEAIADATTMEAALRARVPEIAQIVSRLGSPAIATDTMGLDQADVFVRLIPADRWRAGLDRPGLIAQMQAIIDEVTPGSEPAFTQPIQMRFNELVGGASTDVALAVVGDDLAALWQVARAIEQALTGRPGVADARILAPPEVSVVDVRPDVTSAGRLGLEVGDVLDAVAAVRLGLPAGVTQRGTVAVPVVVTLGAAPPAAADLAQVAIPSRHGLTVSLGQVATITPHPTPGLIAHEQGKRQLVVGFNVRGGDLGGTLAGARAAVAQVVVPPGVRLVWGGQYQALAAAKARLALVVPAVLVLILLVLGLTFGAARPALIVFGHVPFACVGGIAALTVRGLPLSVAAAVGFIALSGIAVMNGVVLMTDIREREQAGADPATAAAAAGRARCRAVSMTAMVAALGFVPMALATGVGAEVQRPLATVVVGGLISSTTLTLVVLPVIYPWLARRVRTR